MPSTPSLRIVIIGGVAGGMSAAARARRMNESAQITVLEKNGFISFANCGLPYYLAGRIDSRDKLLVTTQQTVKERFDIDTRVHSEVTAIDRSAKTVSVTDHAGGTTYTLAFDKLIIATGASPIVPRVNHIGAPNVFVLRSVEDTLAIDAFLKSARPARVAIIGAGFIGLETAEAMVDRGLSVTLVEKNPHVLPPLDPEMAWELGKELESHGVRVITGAGLTQLQGTDDRVTAIELDDGTVVETDMVLMSIGVRPATSLASAAGLTLGATGAIAVDPFQRTSDPDIYAVGDAVESLHGVTFNPARIPLAGPANRQGRIAGHHAATGSSPGAPAVFGTAAVQVFSRSAALTGCGERAARAEGFDFDVAYATAAHHVGYYPGAQQMRLKVIYQRDTGKILGAQAVGGAGVDKRIDVIATAMHFGGRIDDLTELDLVYAPQFGAAKDPIHMAGFVAVNQRDGLSPSVSPAEVGAAVEQGAVLLDVRTPAEYAQGHLPGAVSMPLETLRARVGELDPTKSYITYCRIGQRGYYAQRLLNQRGFTLVSNLKGGYLLARQTLSQPGTNPRLGALAAASH